MRCSLSAPERGWGEVIGHDRRSARAAPTSARAEPAGAGAPARNRQRRGSAPDEARRSRERDIQDLVAGSVIEGPLGACFVAERTLTLDHRHGDEALGRFFDVTDRGLGCLARSAEPLDLDRESIVFLDTETTGLAGGTGTYAFMVGLAFFRGDQLLVRQFFMRHHAEEPAMLAALSAGARPPRGGGHVQRQVVRRAAAADALHGQSPARRRSRLRSTWTCCTRRGGSGASSWSRARSGRWSGPCWVTSAARDVPSLDDPGPVLPVPARRRSRAMAAVFEHNLHDVLSLVALTCRLGRSGLWTRLRMLGRRSALGPAVARRQPVQRASSCSRRPASTRIWGCWRRRALATSRR